MDSDRIFTLKAFRREFGVTARTLRYYEEQGLLAPERVGERRLYRAQDRRRLRFVLICRRAGLPLSDVRRLASVCFRPDARAAEAARGLATLNAFLAVLMQRRLELDALIAELEQMQGPAPSGRLPESATKPREAQEPRIAAAGPPA